MGLNPMILRQFEPSLSPSVLQNLPPSLAAATARAVSFSGGEAADRLRGTDSLSAALPAAFSIAELRRHAQQAGAFYPIMRDRLGHSVSVDRAAPDQFEFCAGSQSKRPCCICVATAVQKSNRLRERARRAFSCSSRAILHAVASPCRSRSNEMTADTLMRRDIDSTSINVRSLRILSRGKSAATSSETSAPPRQ